MLIRRFGPVVAVASLVPLAAFGASCGDDDPAPATAGGNNAGGANGSGAGGSTSEGGGATGNGWETEFFRSGSRLQAVYRDAGDGAEMFNHFLDTTLDTACRYGHYDDNLVCVPSSFYPKTFADAECTEAVVASGFCGDVPNYFSSTVDATCGDGFLINADVWKRGAQIADTPLYAVSADGSCVGFGAPDPDQKIYERIAVDASDLQAGAVVIKDDEAGIAQWLLEADDGSMRVVGPWDVERDTRCGPQLGWKGEQPCLGTNLAYGSNHSSSASCSSVDVAYGVFDESCAKPQAIVDFSAYDPEDCDSTPALHSVGDKVDGPVYQGSEASCTESPADLTYFAFGPQSDGSEFPQVDFGVYGTGRITATTISAAGITVSPAGGQWRDTTLDTHCQEVGTTSGTRCLPGNAIRRYDGQGAFADAACTVPLVGFISNKCLEDPTHVMLATPAAGSCGNDSVHTVTELGAAHAGDIYHLNTESCDASTPDPDQNYYGVGKEIPLTEFVEIKLVTGGK